MTVGNKAIAQAFRNAIPKLWDGKEGVRKTSYICVAIRRGNPNYDPRKGSYQDPLAVVEARKIIWDRICGSCTLEGWLQDRCGIPIDDTLQTRRMQDYRHTWLQALIKEFETKK